MEGNKRKSCVVSGHFTSLSPIVSAIGTIGPALRDPTLLREISFEIRSSIKAKPSRKYLIHVMQNVRSSQISEVSRLKGRPIQGGFSKFAALLPSYFNTDDHTLGPLETLSCYSLNFPNIILSWKPHAWIKQLTVVFSPRSRISNRISALISGFCSIPPTSSFIQVMRISR